MTESNTPGANPRRDRLRRLAGLARWVGRMVVRSAIHLGLVNGFVRVIDVLDERAAQRLQGTLGRRRWLVSWQRDANGRWRARLSGPELIHTIERTGGTRWRAIRRSVGALDRLPTLRARIGRKPRRVAGGNAGNDPA